MNYYPSQSHIPFQRSHLFFFSPFSKLATMKRRQASVLDFPNEILKEILIWVARSSDGAQNLAKALSVCKVFQQFVEDEDVLRAVAFDKLVLTGRWESFQLLRGLINRCAQAGHAEARFLLAKVILVSTSQLLRATRAVPDEETLSCDNPFSALKTRDNNLPVFSFMENFLPERHHSHGAGFHFDLVRFFLFQVRHDDFLEMQPYLYDYMEYFVEDQREIGVEIFLSLSFLCCVQDKFKLAVLKFAERTRDMWHLYAGNRMQIFRMAIQLKCIVEAGAEMFQATDDLSHGGLSATILAERVLSVPVKLLRAIKKDLEKEIIPAFQRLVEQDWYPKVLPMLKLLAAEMTMLEDSVIECKSIASQLEDLRGDLISRFDDLLNPA